MPRLHRLATPSEWLLAKPSNNAQSSWSQSNSSKSLANLWNIVWALASARVLRITVQDFVPPDCLGSVCQDGVKGRSPFYSTWYWGGEKRAWSAIISPTNSKSEMVCSVFCIIVDSMPHHFAHEMVSLGILQGVCTPYFVVQIAGCLHCCLDVGSCSLIVSHDLWVSW